MQNKDSAKKLADAIEQTHRRFAAGGSLDAVKITFVVIEGLALEDPEQWAAIRDEAAFAWIRGAVERSIQHALRAAAKADDRQFLLPGFKRLEQYVKLGDKYVATAKLLLSEYRVLIAECERRIDSYQYARRSSKAEKRDRELLRELHKFDPVFARLAEQDPDLTLERAKDLSEKHLREVAEKHRRPTR
jgi:hypothetical protein